MQRYSTRAGDVVDAIAVRYYGTLTPAILRQVFDANPGLAGLGAILPAGVSIVLPDISSVADPVKGIALWN